MSLVGRWVGLINRIATGNTRYKIIFAPVAGILYVSSIGLCIFISLQVDTLFSKPVPFNWDNNYIISVPIIVIGLAIMATSVYHFIRVKGTPVPLSPPPVLVTSGPYQYARNPMLTGIFIQLFGLALLIGSPSLLFIFTPLFIGINVWELKTVEEPELEKRLGTDYIEYKKRVPMFFPLLKKQ